MPFVWTFSTNKLYIGHCLNNSVQVCALLHNDSLFFQNVQTSL